MMALKPNQSLANRQLIKEQLLAHFLEKPQTRAYRAYQSQHPELPSYQRLIQLFGSWQVVAREVWGVEEARQPKEWNWEASIRFIQTKYPERLTSTQYREQGKKDRQLPSYAKILQHYKSWDAFSREVWGIGSCIQAWDRAKIEQAVRALSTQLISSHQYLKLRNRCSAAQRQQYPTYEMILREFETWEKASKAIWGDSRSARKFWTSREELILKVKEQFPQPVTSSYYVNWLKSHSELEMPSFPVLQKWFGTWHELTYQVWGVLNPIWTPETILAAISQAAPKRVTSTVYNQLQAGNPQLPNYPMIQKHFGSWTALSNELWGTPDQWTPESAIEAIRSYFESRPTSAIYRKEVVGQQGELILPTSYQCERLFGSWSHAMAIAFEGEPLSFKDVEKRSRLSDEELIHLMRQTFNHRPSYSVYQEKSEHYHWLPNVKTYTHRFGSWELAMKICYPTESGFKQRLTWSVSEALQCIQAAYKELGESLSPMTYQMWQKNQDKAPALNTITRLFGSFAEATALFGYQAPSIPRWTEEEVHQKMKQYFESVAKESQAIPLIYDYLDQFNQAQEAWPSLRVIRRTYGGWRQAVRFHCSWISETVLKDYELKQTPKACLNALKWAYQELGDPFTRSRYELYQREQSALGEELASAYQVVIRFGSWKLALEAAGIDYFHYTDSRAQLGKQLNHTELETNTLKNLLDWCLS